MILVVRTFVVLALFAALPMRAGAQEDSERARVLFEQSAGAYQEGRFEAAAGMLEEAYRLDPEPILLYNLARARESNGEDERAADAYRRYLELEPEAENRRQIEARIEGLTPEDVAQEAPVEPVESVESIVPVTEETESPRPMWAPWLVAGLGAALAGGGVVVGVMATSRASDAEAAPNHQAGSILADEADGLASTSTILLAAGGGVALAGVIWGIVWAVKGADETDEARVQVGPTGARISF